MLRAGLKSERILGLCHQVPAVSLGLDPLSLSLPICPMGGAKSEKN